MQPDIIRKLEAELNAGIATEAQVVYVMAAIRKIIELEQSADQYPDLQFHADWVLHTKMDRKAAKAILEKFDAAHIHLQAGIELDKLPSPLRNEIERISQMKSFKKQLTGFLSAHNLPKLTKHRSDGWTHFLHLYAQVVEDCPLVVKGSGLANIAKVTVHLEMARETVKHDHGEEMLFKVTWTIEDKKGGSGDIYIINSFSVT